MPRAAAPAAVPIVALCAAALAGCSGGGSGAPTADTTVPTAPQDVTAVADSATQVTVSWSASSDAGSGVAGYRVFRHDSAAALATVTATSYVDTAVVAGTTYSYGVRAFDGASPANESSLSATVQVTTPGMPLAGLDQRPVNSSCRAPDRAGGPVGFALERAFPNLSFSSPVAMLQASNDSARWFVVEQDGRVRVFRNSPSVSSADLFVDIGARVTSGGEAGLLGMAFHPRFPVDGRVYLSYTGPDGAQLVSRISEFRASGDAAALDPASERVLIEVEQPFANHNGGHVAFGPDGHLYIGLGDGGSGNDPFGPIGNGQNLQTLLGKMLRISVDEVPQGQLYGIPADNPFAAQARCGTSGGTSAQGNCAEIHAYGFRNPWRWSFDRQSGELWVGDVGQSAREEIDRVVRGGNYGWRCLEGTRGTGLECGPNPNPLPPVGEDDHDAGISVTGGYVYRGTALPALIGRYVFADFGSGRIWSLPAGAAPTLRVDASTPPATDEQISSFAQDRDGELYVVAYGGRLYRLTVSMDAAAGVPAQLTQTGCVNPQDPVQPASGLIPHAPNAPYWADGAALERWIALPDGTTIDPGSGQWDLPHGTVLMQHLRLGGQLVETRLLMRHPDGVWQGYSYRWNAARTDATLVPDGASAQVTVDGQPQTWIYPSGAQCLRCHGSAAGSSLGLETAQLNRDFTYPQTGRTANQLVTLNAIGTLNPQIVQPPDALPSMPDPYGAGGTLAERARAYLHANCSQCHRPGGGTSSSLDLRYTTALAATNACNADPQSGDLGIPNAKIIAPADAARSVLLERMSRRDLGSGQAVQMPPLATSVRDLAGEQLIRSWIDTAVTFCN